MSSNSATNTTDDGAADGGFISFSNDNSLSNRRKPPFKLYNNHQNHQHFSPQGFSSPIHNQRNFNRNRRQSGNSYGDRFRGNQSYSRGSNWKSRTDDRKPFNNRSFNQSGCDSTVISDYFHMSMIQDPWKHFQQHFFKTNATIDKNSVDGNPEKKSGGGSSSD